MRAQISVEMLIIAAVVIALVLVVANSLMSTANQGSEKVKEKSGEVFDRIDSGALKQKGDLCKMDGDCISGSCDSVTGRCV